MHVQRLSLIHIYGSIGFRWGEKGKWNLESIAAGTETELSLTLLGQHDAVDVYKRQGHTHVTEQ